MQPNEFESTSSDSLDEFIDAALRSEPMRSVPVDFQHTLQERVARLAEAQRERRRFRLTLFAATTAFVVVSGAALGMVSAGGFVQSVAAFVPGALGYYDSLRIAIGAWALPGLALTLCIGTGIVTGGALYELRRARRIPTLSPAALN